MVPQVRSSEKGTDQTLVRSLGSEIGERNGLNPGSAGSEFGERNWPNPGSEFGFGVQ